MKIIIEGDPIADVRPRHTTVKGCTWTYDPKAKEKEEVRKKMALHVFEALNCMDREIVKEASNLAQDRSFSLWLTFHMPIPKSFTKRKIRAIGNDLLPMISKPDIDNLTKFYLDCANGVLFPDDRMINLLTASKQYSTKPRTEIIVQSQQIKELL